MSTLMILGASILQLPAIKKAIEMGHRVVVADMNPDAVGFHEDGVIKEYISTIDTPALLESARKHNIDGIMTLASDMPMRSVATISKELNLVGISEETSILATNKGFMRDALLREGVPVPLYFRIKSYEEYCESVRSLFSHGYSCIVKPADNSGSRGVSLLHNSNYDQFDWAYQRAIDYSRCGEVMIEEFMEGPEVSVETITTNDVCHVVQITDKITNGAPFFVEMGHSQPSQLPKSTLDAVSNLAILANKALGIDNGPSHTEIIVTNEGPKIVEVGARLGGDNITTMLTPLSTGVDMVECCINIALGEKPNLNKTISMASAIKYIAFNHGVIQSISGLDNARSLEGIKQVSIVHKPGDSIDGIKNSADRVGFVISQADTVTRAFELCDEALSKIIISAE